MVMHPLVIFHCQMLDVSNLSHFGILQSTVQIF